MLKTNLKNFYVGDNKKITISNTDGYENCKVTFSSGKDDFEIQCIADFQDSKPVFSFKSGLINKAGRYSVFAKYYNTVKDDDAETNRVGMIDVLIEENDENKIKLAYLIGCLDAITDKMMGRVRSDYSSYTIADKSVVALSPDDLETARAMVQRDISILKRKIYGSKSNKMLFSYSDK